MDYSSFQTNKRNTVSNKRFSYHSDFDYDHNNMDTIQRGLFRLYTTKNPDGTREYNNLEVELNVPHIHLTNNRDVNVKLIQTADKKLKACYYDFINNPAINHNNQNNSYVGSYTTFGNTVFQADNGQFVYHPHMHMNLHVNNEQFNHGKPIYEKLVELNNLWHKTLSNHFNVTNPSNLFYVTQAYVNVPWSKVDKLRNEHVPSNNYSITAITNNDKQDGQRDFWYNKPNGRGHGKLSGANVYYRILNGKKPLKDIINNQDTHEVAYQEAKETSKVAIHRKAFEQYKRQQSHLRTGERFSDYFKGYLDVNYSNYNYNHKQNVINNLYTHQGQSIVPVLNEIYDAQHVNGHSDFSQKRFTGVAKKFYQKSINGEFTSNTAVVEYKYNPEIKRGGTVLVGQDKSLYPVTQTKQNLAYQFNTQQPSQPKPQNRIKGAKQQAIMRKYLKKLHLINTGHSFNRNSLNQSWGKNDERRSEDKVAIHSRNMMTNILTPIKPKQKQQMNNQNGFER